MVWFGEGGTSFHMSYYWRARNSFDNDFLYWGSFTTWIYYVGSNKEMRQWKWSKIGFGFQCPICNLVFIKYLCWGKGRWWDEGIKLLWMDLFCDGGLVQLEVEILLLEVMGKKLVKGGECEEEFGVSREDTCWKKSKSGCVVL